MKWNKKVINVRNSLMLWALMGIGQVVNATEIIPTPDPINFGSIVVGQQSAPQIITLSLSDNGNDNDIDATSVSPGFILSNISCVGDLTQPSGNCQMQVIFAPTTDGPVSGDFQVDFTDPDFGPGSNTLTLLGTGIAVPFADLTVVPSVLDFANVAVDSNTTLSTTISNVGTGDASLDPLFIIGSGEFTQTSTCGSTLASGQSCIASVNFGPTFSGSQFSSLEVMGQDLFSGGTLQESVDLLGNGIFVDIDINPDSLSFSDTLPGAVSSSQTLTLVNTTNGDLLIDQISVDSPFTQSNNCSSVLSAGSSCVADVAFAPSDGGSFSGEFSVSGYDATMTLPFTFTASLSGSTLDSSDAENILRQIPTGGNPNLESVVVVIADTCTSGRADSALQEDCNALIDAADESDSGAEDALRAITPERATKATRLVQQSGMAQMANVATRLANLRNRNARSGSLSGLKFKINGEMVSAAQLPGLNDELKRGGSAGDEGGLFDANLGGWVSGTVSTGEKDGTGLDTGLDFSTSGITAGLDYRINEQFVLGGALGYMSTDSDLDSNGGSLDVSGYSLTLYGTYLGPETFYADFSIAYGSNDFDQKRNLNYTLLGQGVTNQTAKADYDGDMFTFTLGSGYDFHSGGWTFGPRAHLDYIKVDVDSFTETMSNPLGNGAGWATTIDDTDQTWLTLKLGGRATYAYGMSWGVLTPYAGADWLHEFKNDSLLIQGGFAGDPGSLSFKIKTEDPDKNYFRINFGLGAVFQNGMFGFLDYRSILSNDRWDRQTFNAGLRMEF